VQTTVIVAEPADAITAYAREHAVDLIAMATHGRQLLSQMVLGSTAAQVVHDACAHVLLYRPPPDSQWRLSAAGEPAAASAIASP
jgi:nucleotide-binding universal stress UspA family protein